MRGKQVLDGVDKWELGITPAGAGKTNREERDGYIKTDHPRRCGENAQMGRMRDVNLGSPPQVRGKLNKSCVNFRRQRITPAGAGKTQRKSTFVCTPKDHPRRCGENSDKTQTVFRLLGSPPQVRGKLVVFFLSNAYTRITPAGAGKTRAERQITEQKTDHPRRCGENRAVIPATLS